MANPRENSLGDVELVVRPGGQVLSLKAGDNLLQALRANKAPISYSCEDGRCGLCCCKLIRGDVVQAGRPPRPVADTVSPYVLACQSTLADDCVVEIPEPEEVVVHRPRKLKARLIALDPLAPDVRRLILRYSGDFSYSPGQFTDLQFAPGLVRSYSMAGLPRDKELVFHVQIHPYGRASGYVLEKLKPGDNLRLSGPLGSSYLRQHNSDPIILVAAKTGLAPVFSILRALVESGRTNPVYVYAGFMSAKDCYAVRELDAAVAQNPAVVAVHKLIATGPLEPGMRRGLLTNAIDQDFCSLAGYRAYVFGSPYAAEACARLLRKKGVVAERLYADPFHVTGD